jgi:glyoxylase-like metal-dependent hydrolase (beta-lactamase superfamily II)
VYRLGSWVVNWYLIEDGGRFTVIDAGLNKQFDQLPGALANLGASLDNVEAVVLTHAHADHLGSSAQIKDESGAAVHVHESDAALARGEAERKTERGPVKDLVHPFAWKVVWWFVTNGGLQPAPPVAELSTFADGEVLDLPGSPRVIHTPGAYRRVVIDPPRRARRCLLRRRLGNVESGHRSRRAQDLAGIVQ